MRISNSNSLWGPCQCESCHNSLLRRFWLWKACNRLVHRMTGSADTNNHKHLMTRSMSMIRELVRRVEDVEATVSFSMVSVAHEFGKWKIHPSQKCELIMPTCFKVDVGRPVAFHDARVRTWKPCNNHSNDKRSELPLSNDELYPIWVLQELISKKVNKLYQKTLPAPVTKVLPL